MESGNEAEKDDVDEHDNDKEQAGQSMDANDN